MKIRITFPTDVSVQIEGGSVTRFYHPGDVVDGVTKETAEILIKNDRAIPWDDEAKPKTKKVKHGNG